MNLTSRINRIENYIKLNEDLFPQVPDFDNMPLEEINRYIYKSLIEQIKTMKQFCKNIGIDIKDKESFCQGLRSYAEFSMPEEPRKEFYSNEIIDTWGNYFEENKERLIKEGFIN